MSNTLVIWDLYLLDTAATTTNEDFSMKAGETKRKQLLKGEVWVTVDLLYRFPCKLNKIISKLILNKK